MKSLGSSPPMPSTGRTSHWPSASDQAPTPQMTLTDEDKETLSNKLAEPEQETSGLSDLFSNILGSLSDSMKSVVESINQKINEIHAMVTEDDSSEFKTEKYMKISIEVVKDLSQMFVQFDVPEEVTGIFTELDKISDQCLKAYNNPHNLEKMNTYVTNEAAYFLPPKSKENGQTPNLMDSPYMADIRELCDLVAKSRRGEGDVSDLGDSLGRTQLDAVKRDIKTPLSRLSFKLQELLKEAPTPPTSTGVPTAVPGASPPPIGADLSKPEGVFGRPQGEDLIWNYFFLEGSNANVRDSKDAIKAVKSGSEEEIEALNEKSENEMGRSLKRTPIVLPDYERDRFKVTMRGGMLKPAQVALLAHVDPMLYRKLMNGRVYDQLDQWVDRSGFSKDNPNLETLGTWLMMDKRSPEVFKVLQNWQNTSGSVSFENDKLVIRSKEPLTQPGEPEAKAFLERVFGDSISFTEGNLDSIKTSIIAEIDTLADSMGMDMDALTQRQKALKFEQKQCELEYQRLNHSRTAFLMGLSKKDDPAGQSSQYYRWSVLNDEIQTIDKLMEKRELLIGRLKEQITELSEQTDTSATLLPGTLGTSLEEGAIVTMLHEKHKEIIEKAKTMYEQEVIGANSVEAYLAKRAPDASSADDALQAISLESKDAKITLVYERWGRYHGLSREKVNEVYHSDMDVFLTAVSNSPQDEKMKMNAEEKEHLKQQLGANTKFFKSNPNSKWAEHQAREAPSDVTKLSQTTPDEIKVDGEQKTIDELTPTQKKQVLAENVLERRCKALIKQRAQIDIEAINAAKKDMPRAVKESVKSYATYLAVQMVHWEIRDGMSKDALLSPMCERQADGEWVVRDDIFSGPKETLRDLNKLAKQALEQAMAGNKSDAALFLNQMESIKTNLTSTPSIHATYRTHYKIEMAKFERIEHTIKCLTNEHAMPGIPLPSVTQATFSGRAAIDQDSGDRAVFMHESPPMDLWSDPAMTAPQIKDKLNEYRDLTSAQVETKAREIMANCGFIQRHWGAFKVDQKIKAIQTRLRIQKNYPLTDAERAEFRDILDKLTPEEKTCLWTDCGGWRTFLDSSALQALCPAKINAAALDALFADPRLLDETSEPSDDAIQELFNVTHHWTHRDSGLLDAAMMRMPESVRQKVAQYGPSIGQADHVNHQVRSDPKNLFDRYMERLKTLDPPPPPGSLNVIDSEFKAMVRFFSANSGELSDEQKTKMKHIVEDKLSELTLDSITNPAHQEALAILAETQGDLHKLGIKMGPLTDLFFTTDPSDGGKDTSWYAQANASGNPMVARFHSAMTYHALARALGGSELDNDNILKTMLALRSVENQRKRHGAVGNEFMNRITQCVSDPGLASVWTNKVKDSLTGLKGVHEGTHQLMKQLHRDIFDGHNINLSASTLDNFRYDSKSGQLTFEVKNSEGDPGETFSLDAIAMTLNTNTPKYSDIPEVAKGVLKNVYYGDRDMGAGVHVCMGTDLSERADELMTKDQRFLVKRDTVWVKAKTDADIEWRKHVVPTEELHQKLARLEHLSVWQSGTTLYFYDQHMDCQYTVEENVPLIRLSDNKTLYTDDITLDGFNGLTWTAGDDGKTVVDMYKKGKKCGALTKNEFGLVNQNGQVLVGTTENQLIFKDGTMFEVWQFDPSGLKQVLRSEDPVSKSPIPVKEYDQESIANFTKPVGAMSTLMWMANHSSEMTDALAWPSEKEVVPFDELTVWVTTNKENVGLMQQLQARLDDLVIVDASGQAVQKDTVLRLIPTDPATPNDSNALMLLDAAVKQGDQGQINQLCKFIQGNIDNVAPTPTQRPVLAGLVAGISDESLKEAMGIALDGVEVHSSRHIEAYRQLDKRDNNQLMFMADRTTYARGLDMPKGNELDQDSVSNFKEKVDQKYQTLRSQLDNMLVRLGMNDPMSTSYLLNAMIQGDPHGLIPATMREDVERLALNAMFMHTESQYLGDVVGLDKDGKAEEAKKLLGINRHYGNLIERVQKGLASPDEKRLLALLMRCEQKLGHRLRKEQYDSVMDFIDGRVSIAQLNTGFGKTDVLLFLLALYKGHGKGARVITPKTLIEMNATDYERKLQDFGVSVWQPSLSFNEARGSNAPLEQFFNQLTMHNNRGDICFAPIEFDMQLKDLRSESEVAWLNEADLVTKGNLKERIDLLDRIQQAMGGMFSVVDEAPVVKDVTKAFNVKAGEERMFENTRVELCEKATKAIFKYCNILLRGDICEIDYKKNMNGMAQNVFNEVFGVVEETGKGKVTVPSGDQLFNLGEEKDWKKHFSVSGDRPSNGELGLVVSMLTSSALEVSKKQLNWQYGFRTGDNQSLTVVPYEANNKASSVGTSYQNREMTTMLTYLAIQQNKEGYFGDPSKVSGILSFMATNAQELCKWYPAVFKASTETALTQLMALAIEVQRAYQGRPMHELSLVFDRLANAAMNDATDDPLANELRGFMEAIKVDDNQLNDLIFKVITNTKESERSFNANTNEIQTGQVQFSGTFDEGLIPAADLLRGTYQTVKVAVKGVGDKQELAAVNEYVFGSKKIDDATLHANGPTAVMGVADESLKKSIEENDLINAFINKTKENHKVQLLVDSGALIQGRSNHEVARRIHGETQKNVVYYDTEADQLRCITNDHVILSMPELIAKVKSGEIPKEDIKAFFDQARATGTDIMKVLMDDVEIMLTASTGMEKNEWVQGFGRMRGLGDKMHLVAPHSFVKEVQDGGGPVQIQHMWDHVCKRTDMRMNQKILKRVQTELNGLIKQEVSEALKTWGKELTADQKQVVNGVLSQLTCYNMSEFERPPKELSDQGALDAYLNQWLDEKRALLAKLPMFLGDNNFLNDVHFRRVDPPFNRQSLSLEPSKTKDGSFHPKDIATAIIQSANHINTALLADSPLKVSDANTQSQALAQATAQATVQATAQGQSQAQAQATAEGSADISGVFTPSSDGKLTCKKTLLKQVVVMPTLEKAVQGELTFEKNPSLHQFLTHMKVTKSIRFSHGFLSQCEPGKMPVVHHIFKKDDQYYVFTSEEVATLKPQDNGYEDGHNAFHGDLGLVDASWPDTKESATLLALQCLMDGDHRNKLNMESRLNQAYKRIFQTLISAIDMTSKNPITTGINYLNSQLPSLHGVDHFMATQLLGQLQAQVNDQPSVTLVATDGVFRPVTQKPTQPIAIMGLVSGGQMDDIIQKMTEAINGHFWKQQVLTRTSTFRTGLISRVNTQMTTKHQEACEKLKGELEAEWESFSTKEIDGQIQALQYQIAEANKEMEAIRDPAASDDDSEDRLEAFKKNLQRLNENLKFFREKREKNNRLITTTEQKLQDFEAQITQLKEQQRQKAIDQKQQQIADLEKEIEGLGSQSVQSILNRAGIDLHGMEIDQVIELFKIVVNMVVHGSTITKGGKESSDAIDALLAGLPQNWEDFIAKIKHPLTKGGITYKEQKLKGAEYLAAVAEGEVKDRCYYTGRYPKDSLVKKPLGKTLQQSQNIWDLLFQERFITHEHKAKNIVNLLRTSTTRDLDDLMKKKEHEDIFQGVGVKQNVTNILTNNKKLPRPTAITLDELYSLLINDVTSTEISVLKSIMDNQKIFKQCLRAIATVNQTNTDNQIKIAEHQASIERLRIQITNLEAQVTMDDASLAGTPDLQQLIVDHDRLQNELQGLPKQNVELDKQIEAHEQKLRETKEESDKKERFEKLKNEIAELTTKLKEKNNEREQIEARRAAFESKIPNQITQKMTELLQAYGLSDTEVSKLRPQFCPTDEAGNIVGEQVTLGDDHDKLIITLPTFHAEANQIIGSDGTVKDARLAQNFEDDPWMQWLILAECEQGDWITDDNGQRLQLTEDSELIKEAKKLREHFNETNETVWFLLNSTVSLEEKANILRNLNMTESPLQVRNDALSKDIRDSIASDGHSVIQPIDPGFFMSGSPSYVPCLKEAHCLASMTHLADVKLGDTFGASASGGSIAPVGDALPGGVPEPVGSRQHQVQQQLGVARQAFRSEVASQAERTHEIEFDGQPFTVKIAKKTIVGIEPWDEFAEKIARDQGLKTQAIALLKSVVSDLSLEIFDEKVSDATALMKDEDGSVNMTGVLGMVFQQLAQEKQLAFKTEWAPQSIYAKRESSDRLCTTGDGNCAFNGIALGLLNGCNVDQLNKLTCDRSILCKAPQRWESVPNPITGAWLKQQFQELTQSDSPEHALKLQRLQQSLAPELRARAVKAVNSQWDEIKAQLTMVMEGTIEKLATGKKLDDFDNDYLKWFGEGMMGLSDIICLATAQDRKNDFLVWIDGPGKAAYLDALKTDGFNADYIGLQALATQLSDTMGTKVLVSSTADVVGLPEFRWHENLLSIFEDLGLTEEEKRQMDTLHTSNLADREKTNLVYKTDQELDSLNPRPDANLIILYKKLRDHLFPQPPINIAVWHSADHWTYDLKYSTKTDVSE